VRQRREALGLSQERLGWMVGQAQGDVSVLESGRLYEPRLSTMDRYADALDVHPAWLVYGVDVPPPPVPESGESGPERG